MLPADDALVVIINKLMIKLLYQSFFFINGEIALADTLEHPSALLALGLYFPHEIITTRRYQTADKQACHDIDYRPFQDGPVNFIPFHQ